MKQAVADSYTNFTTKFEGKLPFMYLDRLGLVTTGIGNLIDPIGAALGLPWKHPNGSRASASEIRDAWNTVKSHQEMNEMGGGAFGGLTSIRLSNDDIKALVNSKLSENERSLKSQFPGYDHWPADAQMAILSMAWAQGPNFSHKFPKFTRAVNQLLPDFVTAATESHMQGVGIEGRNSANYDLFQNAAKVLKFGYDVEKLYWPQILPNFPALLAEKTKEDIKKGAPVVGVAAALLLGYAAYDYVSKNPINVKKLITG